MRVREIIVGDRLARFVGDGGEYGEARSPICAVREEEASGGEEGEVTIFVEGVAAGRGGRLREEEEGGGEVGEWGCGGRRRWSSACSVTEGMVQEGVKALELYIEA